MNEQTDMILTMSGIMKSFGGVHALRGVDLAVKAGEVHALIGENGAGKSTLMKVLSGALKADEGSIHLDGVAFTPRNPLDARKKGIAMVYQELNLALHLTVEQNLMLGIEKSSMGFISTKHYRERIDRALGILSHPDLTANARVMNLSPAARQLVEIARGLLSDTKVFVLDEPTSSLSKVDTEHLFGIIHSLRDQGVSIIYISHFLEEVKHVADRFTVLRDGETVGSGIIDETPIEKIIELMVGRPLHDMFPRTDHEIGDEVISCSHISGKEMPVDASFNVRSGEILGLAGLVGAGRTEMMRVLFGLDERESGDVKIAGAGIIGANITPPVMMKNRVAFLSEDRKNEGLSLGQSIAENITMSTLPRLSRMCFAGNRVIQAASHNWIDRLGIKIGAVTDKAESLSGGNQQKVAIARLLEEDADIFLFDEPTRGVDVGSKIEIFRIIGELATRGKAIIIVSSYLPELLGICDTIAVMHRGKLGPKRPVEDWDEYSIMNEATSGVEGTA